MICVRASERYGRRKMPGRLPVACWLGLAPGDRFSVSCVRLPVSAAQVMPARSGERGLLVSEVGGDAEHAAQGLDVGAQGR